jgi:hypothetical protein
MNIPLFDTNVLHYLSQIESLEQKKFSGTRACTSGAVATNSPSAVGAA